MSRYITKNDIKLLGDLLAKSKEQNKPMNELLERYNLSSAVIDLIFNMDIHLDTDASYEVVLFEEDKVVTDKCLRDKKRVLKVMEYTLDNIGKENTDEQLKERNISFNLVRNLLNLDIHRDIKDTSYVGNSVYMRVASEINTEFKDARVEGSVEKRVSSILSSIFRYTVNIADNRIAWVLNNRFIRNHKYSYMHESTVAYVRDTLSPAVTKALNECAPAISEAVRLKISKSMKQKKIEQLESSNTNKFSKYDEEEVVYLIKELLKSIATIDKRLDIIIKHCAYVLLVNIDSIE